MIRMSLLLIFIVNSVIITGQPSWELIPKIERNAYYYLEGSIDNKYPISMYLELTGGFCGSSNNNRWNPRLMKGWYEYKRIGKKIPLIGSFNGSDGADFYLKIFVPKSPMDTLNQLSCELNEYKEMFLIKYGYSMDTMDWMKYGQDTFLPVQLKETHPLSWNTLTTLSLSISGINFSEINLSELTNDQYIEKINVESSTYLNGKFYFIIRYGQSTIPGTSGSGHCGAGWEEWLGYLVINDELEIDKFEYYQSASCLEYIETEYSFDKKHPELGIIAK
jgi:hypothetical protein